ncbi:7372_t:CDS:2, partial [Funneliformis caledonium]
VKYSLNKRNVVEKLDLSSLDLQGNLSLEGFTNLKTLDCSDNELTDLDLHKYISAYKKLKELHANHCGLGFLELAEQIHTLNLASNNLSSLRFDLTNLINLEYLNVGLNILGSLNLTNNKKLKHIYCYENQIKELE